MAKLTVHELAFVDVHARVALGLPGQVVSAANAVGAWMKNNAASIKKRKGDLIWVPIGRVYHAVLRP